VNCCLDSILDQTERGDDRSSLEAQQCRSRQMMKAFDRPPEAVPGVEAWNPWRPDEITKRLAGIEAPWCVAGGWALDLWRGSETRRHDDVEIAILRRQFAAFREQLAGFGLFVAGSGEVSALGPDAEVDPGKHQV